MDAISSLGASDFKLGDWWVRPQRNELERAEETAHVEARSMAVLVCLARHAPGVVTKERLLEEVWSDSPYVGDDVISHAVWELRKALGDSARDPVYINTIPRKGYQVVAEILRPQGSPLPMEGVRIDHYDMGGEIGRGAMGVVYDAADRRLGRTVAIKFLAPELTRDPGACRRFEREARLAASLDHPNLATVLEIGETSQGHRYLVNAYYRGGSLKDRLAEGPIEVPEALSLMRQLVAGLGAAHSQGIIHRDVKPANLLLDEHGTLKICDFGIAKLLGATDLTRTGTPLGTPAYKSPEQAEGRPVDHRTDLWSAGVVLVELLTGRRPFAGDYEHAVVHSILSREPRVLEDARGRPVPEALRRFVVRALAKDPAERFQSAGEMTAALDELNGAPSPPRFEGRRRWAAVAVAIVVTLLAVAVWGYWRRASRNVKTATDQAEAIGGGRTNTRDQEVRNHLFQGRTQWLRGNHPNNLSEVRRHFEAAVELLPDSADAHGHLAAFLAESYALLGNKEQDRVDALAQIRATRDVDPRSSLAYAAEAWLLLLEGKFEEGEQLAREAIEIESDCEQDEICDLAYVWLGEALWMQDHVAESFKVLEQGTEVGGGYIRCRLKRAQLYEKSGAKEDARKQYEEVIRWEKRQTTALQALANLHIFAGRFGQAIELTGRLYRATEDPKVLLTLGYALYGQKRWDDAIDIYREAHEAYQSAGGLMPTPLMAIGDIYLEQGKISESQEPYRQALAIFDAIEEPSHRRQAQRAVCMAKLGHLDEAEEEMQSIMHGRVDNFPDLLFYMARIHALKGDWDAVKDRARHWIAKGQEPSRFLDDPSFIRLREEPDYRRLLGLEPTSAK